MNLTAHPVKPCAVHNGGTVSVPLQFTHLAIHNAAHCAFSPFLEMQTQNLQCRAT